jgi:hypothetical protein
MNHQYERDFNQYIGIYGEPLEMDNGNFVFVIQGHNKLWIHIYLGTQSTRNDDDEFTDHQLLILNHPDIGIYHNNRNREAGLDVRISGVDDV